MEGETSIAPVVFWVLILTLFGLCSCAYPTPRQCTAPMLTHVAEVGLTREMRWVLAQQGAMREVTQYYCLGAPR